MEKDQFAIAIMSTMKMEIRSALSKLMYYLDSLFQHQNLKAAEANTEDLRDTKTSDVQAVYDDWRRILVHAHFGLSAFFITQNGAEKGGIRIGPIIVDLVTKGEDVTCSTNFALAAILRFLTPAEPVRGSGKDGIYRGWLNKTKRTCTSTGAENKDCGSDSGKTAEYADGLAYNIQRGWYEFRCAYEVTAPDKSKDESQPLQILLGSFSTTMQSCDYEGIIRTYLLKSDGGGVILSRNQPSDEGETRCDCQSCCCGRCQDGDRRWDNARAPERNCH